MKFRSIKTLCSGIKVIMQQGKRREGVRGPCSSYARYAFGYSDKKPGWDFWLIILGMLAFILYHVLSAIN